MYYKVTITGNTRRIELINSFPFIRYENHEFTLELSVIADNIEVAYDKALNSLGSHFSRKIKDITICQR